MRKFFRRVLKFYLYSFLGLIALFMAAAAYNIWFVDRADQYRRQSAGMTLDTARWKSVTLPSATGAAFSGIPFFHFAGVFIDTVIVYQALEPAVMMNGAIIEREMHCPGLLQKQDYTLFLAWQSGRSALIRSDFSRARSVISSGDQVVNFASAQATEYASSQLGPFAASLLYAKLGLKVSTKLVVKLFTGAVVVLGAFVAYAINWAIINEAYDGSIAYFHEKAKSVCPPIGNIHP